MRRQIDLPFDEMVSALASLPMPLSSAEDIDSWVLPVGQLILALQLDGGESTAPDGVSSFRAWWESLERVGLRPFAVQDRGDNVTEVGALRFISLQALTSTIAAQYSFLNLRAPHLFTHS